MHVSRVLGEFVQEGRPSISRSVECEHVSGIVIVVLVHQVRCARVVHQIAGTGQSIALAQRDQRALSLRVRLRARVLVCVTDIEHLHVHLGHRHAHLLMLKDYATRAATTATTQTLAQLHAVRGEVVL